MAAFDGKPRARGPLSSADLHVVVARLETAHLQASPALSLCGCRVEVTPHCPQLSRLCLVDLLTSPGVVSARSFLCSHVTDHSVDFPPDRPPTLTRPRAMHGESDRLWDLDVLILAKKLAEEAYLMNSCTDLDTTRIEDGGKLAERCSFLMQCSRKYWHPDCPTALHGPEPRGLHVTHKLTLI